MPTTRPSDFPEPDFWVTSTGAPFGHIQSRGQDYVLLGDFTIANLLPTNISQEATRPTGRFTQAVWAFYVNLTPKPNFRIAHDPDQKAGSRQATRPDACLRSPGIRFATFPGRIKEVQPILSPAAFAPRRGAGVWWPRRRRSAGLHAEIGNYRLSPGVPARRRK